MHDLTSSRRRFLAAIIAFTGLASGAVVPSAFRLGRAWAQGRDGVDSRISVAMIRMARLLFPHDEMSDALYAEILDDALTATANDAALTESFRAAEDALDAPQPEDFIDLDETAQIAVMQSIEHETFFVTILGVVRAGLYNHPALWEHIGYEGPSFARGGYLNRGAGEIDWLPEV